ncbi:MAG: DUF86 domain-containing protein [Anaerolineae bacterium]|nr:DUF86 domain-containing protein [Anaerolineae bacterium]
MSSRTDIEFLRDIQQGVRRIRTYRQTPTAITYDQFRADIRTQDAILRNLEIIGEATKHLSPDLRDRYPDVPWKGMAGIRDRLIHHYFGVNLDIVWDIAAVELPMLESQINMILQDEENK